MTTIFTDATVLVTGANGGLGAEFVRQALLRGAGKVYAAARTPRQWADSRVVPLTMDITDGASVAAAASEAADVTMVVNNAGTASQQSLLTGDEAELRSVVETNLWGSIAVSRAFAPVIVANGSAVLLNVLSSASWHGRIGAYSVSKAALWSATNAMRLELDGKGVLVAGVHLGFARTPMTVGLPFDMLEPFDVVRIAYDGVEAGLYEILVDDLSRRAKQLVAGPVVEAYPELTAHTDSANDPLPYRGMLHHGESDPNW